MEPEISTIIIVGLLILTLGVVFAPLFLYIICDFEFADLFGFLIITEVSTNSTGKIKLIKDLRFNKIFKRFESKCFRRVSIDDESSELVFGHKPIKLTKYENKIFLNPTIVDEYIKLKEVTEKINKMHQKQKVLSYKMRNLSKNIIND